VTAVALRGLLSRKLRTVLTAIAIVLGVSMISGTYVLTDTINQSFSQIFHQANATTDAVIVSKQAVTSQVSTPPPLPESLVSIVKSTPGVVAAQGSIADTAQLIGPNGSTIGSQAPTLLFSVSQPRFRQLQVIKGREPRGQEIALDKDTVSRNHLHLGEVLGVTTVKPVEKFTLVGITRFGSVGSIGGAILLSMDLATAQRITGKTGKVDQIEVAAVPGVSPSELVQRLKAQIPPALRPRVTVQTGQQNADDQTASIGQALNFITIALLAFGGIAVFVGAFIIFNTFSITVAQRAREFALLRTLGATRAQILRSVIFEALIVGALSSVLGLLAGFGIAKGLNAIFVGFGIDLPNAGMVIATRTVVVALLVGTIVTLVASLIPAIRATRVPPVAALREGAQLPRSRFGRFTPYIALLVAALGILALVFGIFGSISSVGSRLAIIGGGAILLFIGVALLSPRLIAPLAAFVGWPIERATRITGRLARENAVRNPSRTAVTAAALMIGLALVGFVTIFAAELKLTVSDAVNREIAGDFAVYSTVAYIPSGVEAVVRSVPGVATVAAVKVDNAKIAGIGTVQTNGIQPGPMLKVYRFEWKQGSNATLARMGPHDAIITDTFASDHNLKVGSRLFITTPANRHDTFMVVGIYKRSQFVQNWSIRYDTFARDWQSTSDEADLVNAAPGQNLGRLKQRIHRVLQAQYPSADVYSQQDLKNQQTQNVNQLLALIYVLLAMSVIVSLFGIINTLVLSVYERTREIGMLRAIGTTRRQVRWIIRWESVITSVIGAILGLLVGIILAVLITTGLQSQGIEYTIPIGQLLIWVVFAIFFGIVAAAFPARRAARLDVLQAIAYE
jgi:putative ABC transport system permease protein